MCTADTGASEENVCAGPHPTALIGAHALSRRTRKIGEERRVILLPHTLRLHAPQSLILVALTSQRNVLHQHALLICEDLLRDILWILHDPQREQLWSIRVRVDLFLILLSSPRSAQENKE